MGTFERSRMNRHRISVAAGDEHRDHRVDERRASSASALLVATQTPRTRVRSVLRGKARQPIVVFNDQHLQEIAILSAKGSADRPWRSACNILKHNGTGA